MLTSLLGVAASAAGASPVCGAWDTADVGEVTTLVPVPVSALVSEKNDTIVARGGSRSYRWGRSRGLVRPTVRERSSCLHASVHTGAG